MVRAFNSASSKRAEMWEEYHKKYAAWESSEYNRGYRPENVQDSDEIIAQWVAGVWFVIAVAIFIAFTTSMMNRLIAPEYYAIKSLFDLLTHGSL